MTTNNVTIFYFLRKALFRTLIFSSVLLIFLSCNENKHTEAKMPVVEHPDMKDRIKALAESQKEMLNLFDEHKLDTGDLSEVKCLLRYTFAIGYSQSALAKIRMLKNNNCTIEFKRMKYSREQLVHGKLIVSEKYTYWQYTNHMLSDSVKYYYSRINLLGLKDNKNFDVFDGNLITLESYTPENEYRTVDIYEHKAPPEFTKLYNLLAKQVYNHD